MKLFGLTTATTRRVRALLACGIVFGTGAVGTTALWETTATTMSGEFTTAAVSIKVGDPSGTLFEDPYAFSFPGSLLPGYATARIIRIKNDGLIPFTYTSTVVGANAGANTALVARRAGASAVGTTTNAFGDTLCTSGGDSMTIGVAVTTAPTVFGGASGALAAGGTQDVCIQLTLNMNTPAAYASRSDGTATFTFTATATS